MRDFDIIKNLALLVFAWCFFGINPATVFAENTSEELAACQGAPTYGCNDVNVGGWEPWWEWIERVQIDAIDNTSGKEAYANFENEGPAVLEEGSTVRIRLTPGLSWSGYQTNLYWRVYIDYNRDGDFDDAGETVLEHFGNRSSVDQNITIPAGVNPGCTKVRITVQRDAYAGACESFSFGEMEDYLATLVAGGPTGPAVCADRDATDIRICSNSNQLDAFYTKMVSNVSGDGVFYRADNVKFVEYDDGTARLTGRFINTHRADVVFDADVTYSGRTTTAPAGSPKAPLCNQSYTNPGSFYYYTQTTGTFTGRQHLAGGVINVTRMGPSMQIGIGANVHEMNEFGASGWYNYTIVSQPTSGAHFDAGEQTDLNIRLNGSPTACENGGGTGPLDPCASNLIANPGFENGLTGWNFQNGAKLTSSPVNSGNSALRLDHTGSSAFQDFAVTPGQDWALRYFAKDHSTATNSGVWVQYLDASGMFITEQSERFVTGAYQEFNLTGTAPAGTATIRVKFFRPNSGTNNEAWVDDVCFGLVQPAATSITLANGQNVSATAASGASSANVTYATPAASTTCPQGGLNIVSSGPASGSSFPVGTTTVTFTATDACGNSETSSLLVTVNPGVATSITLANGTDVTATAASGATSANVNYDMPAASTTCPQGGLNVVVSNGPASGSAFPIGNTTVTFTATDACGNSATSDLVVTVNAGSTGGGNCLGTGPTYACNGQIGGTQPWHEWIAQVEFASLDNSSGKEGYKFFNQLGTTSVDAGSSYSLTITPGLSWSGYQTDLYYTACIDFNQDGDFNDAGEEVLRMNATSAAVTGTVQIPANAVQGVTRMRIFMKRGSHIVSSCDLFDYGEIEDYLLCIGNGSGNPTGVLTLNGPANQTVNIAAGQTTATVTFADAVGSTTCTTGGLNVTQTSGPTSGSALTAGTYTVEFTATDACGNTETSVTTLTVNAAAATSISLTCPADVTTPQIAAYGADVFIPVPTASTTCGQGGLTYTYDPQLPANRTPHFAVGTSQVTITATDACGNSATCTYNVTVTPTNTGGGNCTGTAPTYPCNGVNVGGWEPWWEWISRVQFADLDNTSGKEAYEYFEQAGPASVTPGSSATLDITPGLSYAQYQTDLYYTAFIDWNRDGDFDDAGEEVLRLNTATSGATASTTVAIPANATPGLTRLRVVMQRDAYAEACESFSFGEMEDYVVCIGGTTPPASSISLNCTANSTVQIAQGSTTATLGYAVPTASTTCNTGGLNLSRTSGPGPNATRSAGTYTVEYTATDACDNTETCSFTVTVLAPAPSNITLNCTANSTVQIAQGSTTATLGYTVPTASTTCNAGGLNVSRTSGPAASATRGAGTYQIHYTATDACGNSESCNFTVTVLAPAASNIALNCTANSTVQIAQGSTTAALGYTVPTTSTTCNAGGLNLSRTSGPGPNATRGAGTYTVEYTATDACGNTETCSFTVTVLAPAPSNITFNCTANSTVQIAQGSTTATLGYTVPTASTTCTAGGLNVSRTSGLAASATRGAGTYQIHYTATDACGNSESCNFTVTVLAPAGPLDPCANNLIANPGFENGLTGWSFLNGAKLTSSPVNSGHEALRLDYTGSSAKQTFAASPGQPWALRYFAKDHSTATNSGVWVQYRRADGTFISEKSQRFIQGAYQEFNLTGTAPAQTASIHVIFKRPNSGTNNEAWVDDVCFAIGGTTNPPAGSCNDNILFIVGDTNLNSGDQAVNDKLIQLGYTVTLRSASASSTSDANGRGLVIISSTVSSSQVGSKFTDVAVPVLTWESYLYDDLKMTGTTVNHDYGTAWHAQRLVGINAHPISAGLSGTRRIANTDLDWNYGRPASSATKVAYVEGQSSSEIAIFAYDAGDHMVGKVAPAKRIGWFWNNTSAAHITANGWQYFSQAVAWATDCASNSSARVAAPVNLYAHATEQGVELEWITDLKQGDDMFELERENESGDWEVIALVTVPTQSTGTESFDYLDGTPTIGTNNYRVRLVSPLESRESQVRSVDYLSADAVTAFPNPASDQLFVSLKGFAGFDVDLIVYNALGQEQARIEVLGADETPVLIQTGNYHSGIYTVYAVAGGAKKAMRVKVINE